MPQLQRFEPPVTLTAEFEYQMFYFDLCCRIHEIIEDTIDRNNADIIAVLLQSKQQMAPDLYEKNIKNFIKS